MPLWLRRIRGMIVTGLTFAAGVGVVTSVVGIPIWLLGGLAGRELLASIARITVVSFPIGMVFSGLLAVTARGRSFDKLSIPHFTALGAGVGLLYFLLMGVTGAFSAWSLSDAVLNFVLLAVTGGGSAAAILTLARRGRASLEPGDQPDRLRDGRG